MKYEYNLNFFLLVAFIWMVACLQVQSADYKGDIFTIISVQKSGTYLVGKYLRMLTNKDHRFAGHHTIEEKYIKNLRGAWKKNFFCHCHLLYSSRNAFLLEKNNIKLFLMIRDPRDQIVSFAYFAPTQPQLWGFSRNMSTEEIIYELIVSDLFYKQLWPGTMGIDEYYRAFLPWMNTKNVCVVRFEDLVGPQGGGSLELQLGTMRKIADHLGICPTDDELLSIALKLFGKWTFRVGQIGSWKSHFSEYHKKEFKKAAGQLLIDLGYEQDFEW